MKKLLVVVLSALMVLSSAACTQQTAEIAEPAVTAEPAADVAGGEPSYAAATEEEVRNAISDGSAVVLDARSQPAYSGWVYGEYKIGGHIDGAVDFSASWLSCPYDEENNLEGLTREQLLDKCIEDKGISADKPVIICDENGKDSVILADFLASKGITDIKTFDLANWTDGFITYINYELYVPAEVLKAKLDGEAVAEILGDSATVLEVSWGTTEQSGYDAGHIPGAIHVNSDDFDDEDNVYMLESDDVLLKLALSQGITKDSTVVVTGDQIFSCRYATILRYLGVENVFVLTGGANAWVNAGYELSTDAVEVTPATDFGCEVPANESVIDTVEEAEEMLKDPNCLLVDVRTEEERKGETSGYSYFDTAGWIDGSYYGGAGINSSSSMLYYRNIDGTMRNEEEIQKMWVENGLDISRHLSFFCGGGYRAAEAYWDALVMGMWRTTSLFADGWCGWVLAGLDYKTAE